MRFGAVAVAEHILLIQARRRLETCVKEAATLKCTSPPREWFSTSSSTHFGPPGTYLIISSKKHAHGMKLLPSRTFLAHANDPKAYLVANRAMFDNLRGTGLRGSNALMVGSLRYLCRAHCGAVHGP